MKLGTILPIGAALGAGAVLFRKYWRPGEPGARGPVGKGLSDLLARRLSVPQLRTVVETMNRREAEEREWQASATASEKLRREAERARAAGDLARAAELEAAAEIYEGKADLADDAAASVEEELERMMSLPHDAASDVVSDLFGPEGGGGGEGGDQTPIADLPLKKIMRLSQVTTAVATVLPLLHAHVRRGAPFPRSHLEGVQRLAGLPATGGYDPRTAGLFRFVDAGAPAPIHFDESWLAFDPSRPPMASSDFYPGYFSDERRAAQGFARVASNVVANDEGYRSDPAKLRIVTEFQSFAFLPEHGLWDPMTADAAAELVDPSTRDLVPEALHEPGHVPWSPADLP